MNCATSISDIEIVGITLDKVAYNPYPIGKNVV